VVLDAAGECRSLEHEPGVDRARDTSVVSPEERCYCSFDLQEVLTTMRRTALTFGIVAATLLGAPEAQQIPVVGATPYTRRSSLLASTSDVTQRRAAIIVGIDTPKSSTSLSQRRSRFTRTCGCYLLHTVAAPQTIAPRGASGSTSIRMIPADRRGVAWPPTVGRSVGSRAAD
jgi:hypothetical protein